MDTLPLADAAGSNDDSASAPAPRVLKFGADRSSESATPPAAEPTSVREERSRRGSMFTAFIICLGIGLGCQIFTIAGFEWIRILGPVIMTATYAVWGLLTGQHRQPWREQFADNCYFLGFIFTLLSLCVAFAPVALFRQTISAQFIIDQFGVGLGASVVGLLARTGFQNLQPDVAEMQRSVEGQVIDLARTMATQFEKIRAVLDQLERSASDHMSRMQQLDQAFVERIDSAATSAAQLGEESDRQASAIASAVQVFGAHLESLRGRLEEAGRASHDQLMSLSGDLATAVRSMTELVGAAGAMRQASTITTAEFSALNDRVSELSRSFANAAASTERSASRNQEALEQVLQNAVDELTRIVTKFSGDVSALAQVSAATRQPF